MSIKIAINGYGRIGRNILRAIYEHGYTDKVEVVAINDLANAEMNVHLTKYDSVHHQFDADVNYDADKSMMTVNGDKIKVFNERNPADLPWGELGVDVVCECTGVFRNKEKASGHLEAGAKKVLISAPGKGDVDATIVYGVNDQILKASDTVVSNASCTTNCLSPLVKVLNESIGIESGVLNTIHSYTNTQRLIDVQHKDMRRARSATQSLIPTTTGAAKAVTKVLPEMLGKLDGFAVRVPTINVSMVDFTFQASRETSVDEVNKEMKNAIGSMKGVLASNEEPLVSVDFNHNPHSSIFDLTMTRVVGGKLVKVISWYDNEWGFSNRMIDTSIAMMKAK